MKKALYTIFFLLLPIYLCAQGGLRGQVAKKEVISGSKDKAVPLRSDRFKPRKYTEPDTIYCLNTKKQHGWFSPQDIVSLESGKKYGGYVMFTRKNALGHWTKFETFDSYGNRKSLGMRPYILSDDDPRGDQNWIKKVKTGCICEIIADPLGESVVQERVYDKDMNLVYSFSHTPIGDRKYIGTYKDFYGLPAEMRMDSTFTYGTLVVITEDIWGNDSTIEYVDAKGVPKENSNGVGIQFYIYDKDGRVIRQGSANHNGEYVIDNWGNCGGELKYDKKTGLNTAVINMDNNWNPIPLANLRSEAGWHAGTTKRIYRYDEYRRLLEQEFVTIENKPDTNIFGTHKIVYTYDDFGNRTSLVGYNIEGNFAPYSESGTAKEIVEYDSKGRLKYIEWYDKNNQLISTEGYLSRRKNVYGDDDYLDEQVYWAINNEKEDTCYYYKRTPYSYYNRYNDGSYKIDSLDTKGRCILTAYYNADGTPMFNDNKEYHCETTKYWDKGTQTRYTENRFNTRMEACGQYPTSTFLVDSISHTEKRWVYDIRGNICQSYILKWDDYFNRPLAEYDMNVYGNICRAGGTASVRHYIAEVEIASTQKLQFSTFVGKDEFNEPDYICSPNLIYYYQRLSKAGGSKFYDVDNNEIIDFEEFRNYCSKAMSIEITDSLAYHLGLQDNDILLRYGDSYQINDSLAYWDFVGAWSVSQCIEAPIEKNLLVFRINPITKDYGVVSLKLPKGNPSQLGFIAHPTFKTQKQMARIKESIAKYRTQCAEDGTTCLWNTDLDIDERDRNIVIAFSDLYRENRYQPYPLQVTDPSIILAYGVPNIGKSWLWGQNKDSLQSIISNRINCQIVHPLFLYVIKNGICFEEHNFTDKLIGFTYFNYKVPKSQYDFFEKQFKLAVKQMKINKLYNQNYNKNQIFGIWQTKVPESNSTIRLNLLRDGTFIFENTIIINDNVQDGATYSLSYLLTANNGKWYIQGRTIFLSFNETINDCTLSDVCVNGLEGEEKDLMIQNIRSMFDNNKTGLVNNTNFANLLGSNEFIINELSQNELIVSDGSNNRIFKKIK